VSLAIAPWAAAEASQVVKAALEALFAQAGGAQSNPLTTFGFLAVMVVIFYFFLIRPQSKQAKEHKAMLAALKKGDVVVTASGIVGRVHAVADKYIVVEVAPSVRLRILAGSISTKAPEGLLDEGERSEAKDGKSEKDK
jgi:preprotein translocase subunit YajC